MRRSVITTGFFAIAVAALFANGATAHPASSIDAQVTKEVVREVVKGGDERAWLVGQGVRKDG